MSFWRYSKLSMPVSLGLVHVSTAWALPPVAVRPVVCAGSPALTDTVSEVLPGRSFSLARTWNW